ncbi:MAG: low specificity L-threonine aldolase [Alphaproteobacteria bacterium]|nr:MAG: low specificity L-threonine aldolase [Alphaproteobacteria bacterium]
MWFESDNGGPVAPAVMAALAAANDGPAPAYGADALTAGALARIRAAFEAPAAAVHLVATGTAANALALGCLCPPWGTVYCHAAAHIATDECGAPEFYTGGAKLRLLEGPSGKFSPGDLACAIAATAPAGVHNTQPAAVSITNPTEAGAVWTPGEVAAIASVAHQAGLRLHMDGARLANALARLGCSPADLTWRAGVDVLTLGGTKNGLMGAEAVILFDPGLGQEFALRRKRGGHLPSKMRYLAAQFDAWLADGLWLRLAAHANAMAQDLARGLAAAGHPPLHPVDANMVFAAMPRRVHRALRAAGARYLFWPGDPPEAGAEDEPLMCRLVCSPATRREEVAAFLDALSRAGDARA